MRTEYQREKLRRRRKREVRMIIGTVVMVVLLVVGGVGYGIVKFQQSSETNAYLEEAIVLFDQSQYEDAIIKLEACLKYSGSTIGTFEEDVLRFRGEAEMKVGNYPAALHTYKLLLESDKNSDSYKRLVAICQMESGLYEEALAYEPLSARVYYSMALDLIEAKDYEAALESINKGKTYKDGSVASDLAYHEAVIYEYLGDFEKALDLFYQYVEVYESTEAIEREIEFLESRVDGSERDSENQ